MCSKVPSRNTLLSIPNVLPVFDTFLDSLLDTSFDPFSQYLNTTKNTTNFTTFWTKHRLRLSKQNHQKWPKVVKYDPNLGHFGHFWQSWGTNLVFFEGIGDCLKFGWIPGSHQEHPKLSEHARVMVKWSSRGYSRTVLNPDCWPADQQTADWSPADWWTADLPMEVGEDW